MHTRPKAIIAAGATVAVLGFVMVFAYASSVSGNASGGELASAYVVTTDVPAGTKWEDLKPKMKKTEVPSSFRPETAVSDSDALTGRMTVRPLSKGEVVTTTQFGTSPATAKGLELPPNHNAVSFNVPVPNGVARFVQRGDLVNIFVTFKAGTPGQDQTITKLLLPKVQVLSTNIASSEPIDKATGAATGGDVLLTVAVNPLDAERLIFSKENGSVWVTLVNPADGPAQTGGQTRQSVLG